MKNPTLRLHALISLVNRNKGSVKSLLASEEDIRLEFAVPISDEETLNEIRNILLDKTLVHAEVGNILHYTWDVHVSYHGPLEERHALRFKRLDTTHRQ